MFTYHFIYTALKGGLMEIQFCAESRTEAERLFFGYLKEQSTDILRYEVCCVYNASDHDYYGTTYRGPISSDTPQYITCDILKIANNILKGDPVPEAWKPSK